MRHVSDGDIHAWLDGQLAHYPDEDAAWIEEHLSACAECAARAEDARRVHGRAGEILAGDAPDVGEPPPFDTVRGAARPPRAGSLTRTDALRMAATAVVALGVGWMAGRVGPTLDARMEALPDSLAGRSGAVAQPSPAGPAAATAETPAESGVVAESDAVTPATERRAEGDAAEERAPTPPVESARSEPTARAEPGIAPERAVRGLGDDAVSSPRALEGGRALRLERAPAPPESDTGGVRAAAASFESQAVRERGPEAAVPGLAVVSVGWADLAPGVRALRVVQRLDSGEEIHVWSGPLGPDGAVPSSLGRPPPPVGWSSVAATRGDVWVAVRGPVDEARLRTLLDRIR